MSNNVIQFRQAPNVRVLPAIPECLDDFLDDAIKLLTPAIRRQEHNATVEDVIEDIRGGGAVLWCIYLEDKLTAALTTCVVKHPRRTTLKIEFMGGTRMDEWMDETIATLSELARRAELDGIEADGRKGFEKYVGASPFREVYRHYEMELL